MASTLILARPQPIRIAAATTLVIIIAWAASSGDTQDFGVLAYPAIIALQTAREFIWRLEVGPRGLHEKPGIGPSRDIDWRKVDSVLMPDAAWWRINPVLKIIDAPNVQMTAGEGVNTVIDLAVKKGKTIVGTASSISVTRSLTPWLVLLALASVLLGSQLATGGAV